MHLMEGKPLVIILFQLLNDGNPSNLTVRKNMNAMQLTLHPKRQ